jgi:hypothetical protein
MKALLTWCGPTFCSFLERCSLPKAVQKEAAERAGEVTGDAAIPAIRSEMFALAKQYEETRQKMAAGTARTCEMEIIASKMRSLALPAYPLLAELARSESAGKRLAAISILEAIPTSSYLPWLAERVASERPFVAYHATVALLNAVEICELRIPAKSREPSTSPGII